MVPRKHSEDSDPVLEVSAIGTANANGEYVQHDAVAPHKPHSAGVDLVTVVVSSEPVGAAIGESRVQASIDQTLTYPADEEVTSVTKGKVRAKGWGWFRFVAFIEQHRSATFMLAIGGMMILFAALLSIR